MRLSSILRPSRPWIRRAGWPPLAAACAFLVTILAASTATAGSNATDAWTQFQGDAVHSGTVATGPEPGYARAWHLGVPPGGTDDRSGLSPPILADGLLIAVGPTEVIAVDASTGTRAWSVDRDYGPSSAPAIGEVDGRAVLVYTEGFADHAPIPSASAVVSTRTSPSPSAGGPSGPVDSHVIAIDLKTRKPLWDPVKLKDVSRTGVTIAEDTAYVGDSDGNVYAIDLSSGDVRWSAATGGILNTAPAVSGDLVVVTAQGSRTVRQALVALRVGDGEQVWRHEPASTSLVATAPSIGDGLVYVGLFDQTVRAMDLGSGAEVWAAQLNAGVSPFLGGILVAPDALFVNDINGQVYRLDPTTGSRVWDFALNESVLRGSPVLVGEHVLLPTSDGRLVAFSAESGHREWQSEQTGSLLRSLAVDANHLYGVRGGADSGLDGFSHDPTASLEDVVSPTTLDLGRLLGNFAIAAVPLVLVALTLGRLLIARSGLAELPEGEEDEGDEEDEEDEGADDWDDGSDEDDA